MTREKFLSYERVRESGVTNMFDIKVVMMLSGLTRDEVLDIMKHYAEYADEFLVD